MAVNKSFYIFLIVIFFVCYTVFSDENIKNSDEKCFSPFSEKISQSLKSIVNKSLKTQNAKLLNQSLLVKIYFTPNTSLSQAFELLKKYNLKPTKNSFGYCREIETLTFIKHITSIASEKSVLQIWQSDAKYIYPSYVTSFTKNLSAGNLAHVDEIKPNGISGYNLTGLGVKIGLWEGDKIWDLHPDLTGRIFFKDFFVTYSEHATHVAGTIIGRGLANPDAEGMATNAQIYNYNWNNDTFEMANISKEIAASNHSYVVARGWYFDGNNYHWYGNTEIAQDEDYLFGKYDNLCAEWDEVVYNTNLPIIVAAGNDRNDYAPPPGTPHSHNGEGVFYDAHFDDGYMEGGYDTIPQRSCAKNIISVGAVDNTSKSSKSINFIMTNFSSWGPTDDGRIKPDIVAKGTEILSCNSIPDNEYITKSGTSMSAAVVSGTVALLSEQYKKLFKTNPSASLLKGLLIHTATSANDNNAPDYSYGWGLMNARAAADFLYASKTALNPIIIEGELYSSTITYLRKANISIPISVTLSWTDPPGVPNTNGIDDPTPALVNNLDLSIIGADGKIYYPWTLNPKNPSAPASNKYVNNADNVERIDISNPNEGYYTIKISCANPILYSPQKFHLFLSGFQDAEGIDIGEISIYDDGDKDGYIENGELIKVGVALSYQGTNPLQNITAQINTNKNDNIDITNNNLTFVDFKEVPPIGPDKKAYNPLLKYYIANSTTPILLLLKKTNSLSDPLLFQFLVDSMNTDYKTILYKNIQCGEPRTANLNQSSINLPIPDNSDAGVISKIITNLDYEIYDITVSVDITHSYISDLTVELVSPSGQTITLHNRTGNDNINLKTSYSISKPPDGPGFFRLLKYESMKGIWKLKVTDHSQYFSGTLNSWGITIKTYLNNYCLSVGDNWIKYY